MSAEDLIHTCAVCGAEESLDMLLGRMVTDDQMRHLVADVIHMSVPLGRDVVRYLRLFKPAKQRLRLSKAREVLAELLPDMKRAYIDRKGRRWVVSLDMWRKGFEAVFESADKGALRAPLAGNAYLYEVLMRLANQVEGKAEAQREHERRTVPPALREQAAGPVLEPAAPFVIQTVPAPQGPSKAALKMRAQMGLDKSARLGLSSPNNDSQPGPGDQAPTDEGQHGNEGNQAQG